MGFEGNRMQVAKDALSNFILSLPVDCKFSIISFGSRFETMKIEIEGEQVEILPYTD